MKLYLLSAQLLNWVVFFAFFKETQARPPISLNELRKTEVENELARRDVPPVPSFKQRTSTFQDKVLETRMHLAACYVSATYLGNETNVNNEKCRIFLAPLQPAPLRKFNETKGEHISVSDFNANHEVYFAFRGDVSSMRSKVLNFPGIVFARTQLMTFEHHLKSVSLPMYQYAYRKYLHLRSIVRKTIVEFLKENKQTHFVLSGHSMGGAMVLYALLDALDVGVPPTQLTLITFNAVKPSTLELVHYLHVTYPRLQIHRYIEDGDMVPFLPYPNRFEPISMDLYHSVKGQLKQCEAKEVCTQYRSNRSKPTFFDFSVFLPITLRGVHLDYMGHRNYFTRAKMDS